MQRYGSTGSIQDNLSYTYTSGTNKLSSISGSSSASYTYDSNGNVRYDTHRGIGYIIYDPNNLPVYAFLTNGQQLIYETDVNGSRVRNSISGTSDNFYFNGVEGNTEAVSTVAHGSNLIYNILGAGGDNIGQVKVVSQSPIRYYYLKDHLGSIKVTVNTSGTVVGYDDYYPYGMQMSGRSLVASEDGRYKFTGKERDASEGLDYFGARYYDSWIGRWDQVEPALINWDVQKILEAGYYSLSSYQYVRNNPINAFDIDGYTDWRTVLKGTGQFILGVAQSTAGFYLAAKAKGIAFPIIGEINAFSGLTTAGLGVANIIAGLQDKTAVMEEGVLKTTLIKMGASENVAAVMGSGIATSNFVLDVITPEVGVPKLIEYLSKISTLNDLREETQNYAKTIIKEIKEREQLEAKKNEQKKLEEEKKRKEQK